ncbi:hypothetical protein BpHYR1_047588 [Brachionus plicatilis]|uniref:Uncharacterized protein n=1 Tax=Brachionus plicatilis TaxID=10195 RepID=A0A3M7SQ97_BRAPC|nr:hypothetical protein BpHYR1_047588 [Brachionus plicatilis]
MKPDLANLKKKSGLGLTLGLLNNSDISHSIQKFLRMNLNKEKNNLRLILSKICKDYLMFLRSFNSSIIGLNVSFVSNIM